MWIKLKDKRTLVNLRQVKEINVSEDESTVTFKYNSQNLVIKKGEDIDEKGFDELVAYIEGFDKYCVE